MRTNKQTLKQAQLFIDAGIARRLDMSAQINAVVDQRVETIEEDGSLSPEQKAILINDVRTSVAARVQQFAPTWDYPPAPQLTEETEPPF